VSKAWPHFRSRQAFTPDLMGAGRGGGAKPTESDDDIDVAAQCRNVSKT
jgi:hypothetical protein